MRRGFSLVWLGLTAALATIVGFLSYQAGWSAGLATKLPAGAALPYYAYGPHLFGFGFFVPFLFFLVILLLVFGGARRRFWGGWGPGPWGPGGGGYGGPRSGSRGQDPAAQPGSAPSQPAPEDPIHGWPQRPDEQAGAGPRQA